MQRQRGELVPVAEVLSDLGGPVAAIRAASPQALHHFTRFDQVNQLVSASEADADLGFMARTMALCSLPRTNPGNRLRYVRVNGPYTLVMNAGGLHKLPYGNLPRLEHGGLLVRLGRLVQGCIAKLVPRLNVRPGRQQGLNHGGIGRPMQRRRAVLVPRLHVGPGIKARGHILDRCRLEELLRVPLLAPQPRLRGPRRGDQHGHAQKPKKETSHSPHSSFMRTRGAQAEPLACISARIWSVPEQAGQCLAGPTNRPWGISCRRRRLQGVSKKERLTRRFPGGRLLGRNRAL